ncbi:DUF4765 family protein [Treponema vincentii]|uniref:DUF4765 family protein n=1 Tax=Treponema vincentii TaxID=69710 RepID=UPI0020A275E7|nr:DUF4765 family protein [Treponema vincentii]UTC47710.1 hypothetical protein E4N73_02085 [Treponema vincentii]
MIIHGENMSFRFTGDKYHSGRSLAYLIEPPAEPKYKPFESVEKAMGAIKKHGGWVKYKNDKSYSLVVAYDEDIIILYDDNPDLNDLLRAYVFADDGIPCGELMKQ